MQFKIVRPRNSNNNILISTPFFRRLILHSTREQKLKSICDMDNIRSCIPTDVEKLSKGRLCVCTRMSLFRPVHQKNKWHLSRMINFISTSSRFSCAYFILFAAHIASVTSVIVDYRRAMCSRPPIPGCIRAH